MATTGTVSILDLPDRVPIAFGRNPRLDDVIRPSFHGQDYASLLHQVPPVGSMVPRIDLIRIAEGYLHFGAGIDGFAATAEGALVRETALFTPFWEQPPPDFLCRDAQQIDEDWVSIVDAAWHNYYHLLALAMPRLYLAQRHRPDAHPVVPARRPPRPPSQVSPFLFDRMLELSGQDQNVRRIEDGTYRVRNLYLIWVNHVLPTYQHLCDEPFSAFADMARSVDDDAQKAWPRRIFIARPHKPRIKDPDMVRNIERELTAFGFEILQPESLSFEDQIRLFSRATHVVAAHGSGLTNIVFGNDRLRLLEFNLHLESDTWLRPWFLLLANGKRIHYQYLNASNGELTRKHLGEAFRRFTDDPGRGMVSRFSIRVRSALAPFARR